MADQIPENNISTEPPAFNPEEKPSGLSIAAMVVGICSVVFCCMHLNLILGIVAVIMGFIERGNYKNGSSNEISGKYSLWGIILGFVGIGVWILTIVFIGGLGILSIIMEESGWNP